jgi:hypothetical protein
MISRVAFGLSALLFSATSAHALDEGAVKQVVAKFLASQPTDQGSNEALTHQIADVDGDGKPDIVLLWNVMGPTSAWPKLTVFLDTGRSYRALTANLSGIVEKLEVKGSNITVGTLMLGPKDPRCCPTVKTQINMRWQGGKLVQMK